MKRMIPVFLAVGMLAGLLCGCSLLPTKDPALMGRWEGIYCFDSESVLAEFEAMDLYDAEIALLDPAAMELVDVVTFHDDGTYTISGDAEKTMALVEAYYRDAFATFYRHREELETLYGEAFSAMTEAEFYQYYADLYGAADYEGLIELFVGGTDYYAYLDEEESGTYEVIGNRIYFKEGLLSMDEYVTYRVDSGTLTLEYTDVTITYSRSEG